MNETFSHPDQTIRQSYPLFIHKAGVEPAFNLCMKTLPIMLLRLGFLAGFTVLSVIWFGIVMGAASLFSGASGGSVGFFLLLVAFGIPFGAFHWFKRYFLYMLEMAHIAVLTQLITTGELPAGVSQISYGKEIVTQHFGQANILLVVDGLVQGVVNAFTGTLSWLTSFLPIADLEGPMALVRKILDNATEYIGDTIFSYNLARGDDNKWRSSKDGLIYYAQNWKPILKTAAYALVVEYVITGVVFLLLLGPVWGLGALVPAIGGWAVIFGFALAMNVRSALIRPVCLTMVMLTFHESIQNQEINLVWEGKLRGATSKFQELAERARTWVGQRTANEPAATPLRAELI